MQHSTMMYASLLLLVLAAQSFAFTQSTIQKRSLLVSPIYSTPPKQPNVKSAAEVAAEIDAEDSRVQVSGQLPKLRNDFYDENERFKDDPDWITENVPGKIVLTGVELAAQVAALNSLEEKWRKERLDREYEENRFLGWTAKAETYNGRYAMFFLIVGLLTEYWTGVTIPGQVEEMGRILGFIEPQ